jgi:hypothetical protein
VQKVKDIDVVGLVKLKGTRVSGLVKVTGTLLANAADLGSLEIEGDVNLTSSTVHDLSRIHGHLQAFHTVFLKEVRLACPRASFSSCEIDSLLIEAPLSKGSRQVIELRHSTQVNGPITFEGGKGEVHLYPGAHLYGEVEGGKVIKKR